MNSSNISYGDVELYCNELHELAKNIKELLEEIQNECESVQNNEIWTGNASDFYLTKVRKLSSNFEEIVSEIENSILYMASCSDGYSAVDKTIMSEICSNLNISEPNLSTSTIFGG